MGEQGSREAVDRYWAALKADDFEGATASLHDEFTEEWPQSGERIRGASNWLAMVTAHPTRPDITPLRTLGGGDVWVTQAAFDYARDGSPPWQVCAVQECRDGKIYRITEVFGAPFEAAEWRAQWVERM